MMIGKIYKIIHSQSDIIYIGSTFNRLSDRWRKHKNIESTSIGKYIKEFGAVQFKIILIKEYEVIDRKHLEAYEQLWISKTKCINTQPSFKIPILEKEKKYSYMVDYRLKYREKNRELLNEKDKKYREKNKEVIRKKQTEKIKCSCGKEISKANIAKHLKRVSHS